MLAAGIIVALCLAAASTGAIFKPGEWYWGLAKPSWNPPDYVFAPAWLILYGMIAYAAWRVWTLAEPGEALFPMIAFGVQIGLNALWSALFFGLRRPDIAFVEVVSLWLSIVVMMVAYYGVDPLACWLMVPYLLWVTFAGALNYAVWRLNRDSLLSSKAA